MSLEARKAILSHLSFLKVQENAFHMKGKSKRILEYNLKIKQQKVKSIAQW
jgi:hypothetical protein